MRKACAVAEFRRDRRAASVTPEQPGANLGMRHDQEDARRAFTHALAQRRRGLVLGDKYNSNEAHHLEKPLLADVSTSIAGLSRGRVHEHAPAGEATARGTPFIASSNGGAVGESGMQDYRQLDYRLHRAGTVDRHTVRVNELRNPQQRSSSLLTVVILVIGFLASLGGSTTGAPLTELLVKRACDRRSLPYPSQLCSTSSAAQSEAASRTQWIYLSSLPGLLTLGTYSLLMDVRGRRLVLVLGALSASAFPLLIAIVPDTPALVRISSVTIDGFGVVIMGSAVASLLGGTVGKIAQFAVISDLTEGMDGSRRKVLFMALEVIQWIGNVSSLMQISSH